MYIYAYSIQDNNVLYTHTHHFKAALTVFGTYFLEKHLKCSKMSGRHSVIILALWWSLICLDGAEQIHNWCFGLALFFCTFHIRYLYVQICMASVQIWQYVTSNADSAVSKYSPETSSEVISWADSDPDNLKDILCVPCKFLGTHVYRIST